MLMNSPHFTILHAESQQEVIKLHIDPGDIGRDINLGEKIDHECAIVFFDLCKFTSISFTLSTEKVLQILQELFKYISERVVLSKGIVDKFPGDGVVAFFPKLKTDEGSSVNHVDRSIECAAVVMEWFYSAFKPKHKLPKPEHALDLAIGIDAGQTSIARVGTNIHSEIILLGNQVNCASKCQQAAKPEEIIVGQEGKNSCRLNSLYRFSDGPDIEVPGYKSYKVDWKFYMSKATWIKDNK
jgi:class 3 adenylate cyclase